MRGWVQHDVIRSEQRKDARQRVEDEACSDDGTAMQPPAYESSQMRCAQLGVGWQAYGWVQRGMAWLSGYSGTTESNGEPTFRVRRRAAIAPLSGSGVLSKRM